MAAGGDAIARDADGRVVFVEGALPGERVRVRLVQSKKDFARGVAVEVLEASPDRVTPPCVALGAGCGGCSWQHVTVDGQARLKMAVVEDALRRIGRLDPGAIPIRVRPLPDRPQRTTVRLAVDADGRPGQRRRGGHDAVPADACLAVHPRLEELVVGGRFPGADEVVLRVGVASGERAAWIEPEAARAQARVPADVELGPGATVHEEVAGRRFRISIGSFFQSGPVAAEALVAAVDAAIGDALPAGGHLVDAYAGVGLFAATLAARHGVEVTAIETDPWAVSDAHENLRDLPAAWSGSRSGGGGRRRRCARPTSWSPIPLGVDSVGQVSRRWRRWRPRSSSW